MRIIKVTFCLMALLAATAIAGRDKPEPKPKPSYNDCDIKLTKCAEDCEKEWKDPVAYAACAQHACACAVGKEEFCSGKSGIGGPGNLCFS
ncbi:uncharacterized protein M421DRAFT_6032 [Didymella exigua CBS 183.55]|uniref:Extracellular membrane protein CFEM domain-containing protein n=1 Tax=Didymella exigua CBS 183.55 TaxID=1150837 RepID=A0A6A5RKZ5_9PLEO|nr:uncharacterized protein M421DRAFT_6032 [Didymella exigua CBS 183.55]KAF1927778.1 hypothetical protein M421DRAFT_6032 [Didymella exigua CBS 183.55]